MKSKTLIAGFFIVTLGFFLFSPFPNAKAEVTRKTATLWNHAISYDLVLLRNSRVNYDGTSFVHTHNGKRANQVILNTAYFKKEALSIWKSFEEREGPSVFNPFSVPSFVARLGQVEKHIKNKKELRQEEIRQLMRALQDLEEQLRFAAWFDVYRSAHRQTDSEKEAIQFFVNEFTEVRKKAVEYHELSHLLDEQMSGGGLSKKSEVRAFVTELAYGANPRDTLWQVVKGVIHEIDSSRNVDASIQKLVATLKYAQTFALSNTQGNTVYCLCHLTPHNAREIALRLYPNTRTFTM